MKIRRRGGGQQTGNETTGTELGFGDRSCRGDRERSRDAEASHAKKRGGSEKERER